VAGIRGPDVSPKLAEVPSVDVTLEYLGLGLAAFESRIRELDHEVGAIIDDDRGVLRARSGGPHDVEWETDECELIPGRILSHNHPLGDSFSPHDVRLAWEYGAKELRAVTPTGTTYTLGAPEHGWGDYTWDEIEQVAEAWAEAVFRDIDAGRLTTSTPMHVIWEEASGRLDLTYSRVQNDL
jgi:hypothetical protein